MYATFFALVLLAPTAPLAQQSQRVRWAEDGVHLDVGGGTLVAADSGDAVEAVAPAVRDDTRARAILAIEEAIGRELTVVEREGDRTRSTLPRAPSAATGVRLSSDRTTAAAIVDGRLVVWREGAAARVVGGDGLAGVRHFQIAPDGSSVSYIDGYDLWLASTADGARTRLTDDGSEQMFCGELDWVYQEEVYGRFDFRATWWSPRSDAVAFLKIDEEGVDTFLVTDYRPQRLELEWIRYPKAGTTNPRATLHLADQRGKVVAADLSAYGPEDGILLVRVSWTPEGDACVAMVQDREQTWLDLLLVDPQDGSVRRVLREAATDGWVDRAPEPWWLADGSFVWLSARSGHEHLYRHSRSGELLATITAGEWRVRDVIRLDEERGRVAISGSAPGYAIGDTHWLARLDGSGLTRLTSGRGHWQLDWNGDGTRAIARVDHMEKPPESWLVDDAGRKLRQLERAAAPEAAAFPEWHQITARDGEWLDVVVVWPKDLDPTGSYPIWLDTYAGPDSPSIRDRWRGPASGNWYIDLSVNVRSASGRGMALTRTSYRDLGAQELRDLEDAVDWLCRTYPFADRTRVGISGWSYGGFMAAYAMTKSSVFSCGIAGGGVFDWALYDTIYTERYMGTPQSNPEGYARANLITAAKDLKGPLLIVHGAMDDNVHMQNALQLVEALQRAGNQQFELMIYPSARHGVRGSHWPELRRRFMERHLRAPASSAAPARVGAAAAH